MFERMPNPLPKHFRKNYSLHSALLLPQPLHNAAQLLRGHSHPQCFLKWYCGPSDLNKRYSMYTFAWYVSLILTPICRTISVTASDLHYKQISGRPKCSFRRSISKDALFLEAFVHTYKSSILLK